MGYPILLQCTVDLVLFSSCLWATFVRSLKRSKPEMSVWWQMGEQLISNTRGLKFATKQVCDKINSQSPNSSVKGILLLLLLLPPPPSPPSPSAFLHVYILNSICFFAFPSHFHYFFSFLFLAAGPRLHVSTTKGGNTDGGVP